MSKTCLGEEKHFKPRGPRVGIGLFWDTEDNSLIRREIRMCRQQQIIEDLKARQWSSTTYHVKLL